MLGAQRQRAGRKTSRPFVQFGAGCRTRTRHLMITNQLLYQMS